MIWLASVLPVGFEAAARVPAALFGTIEVLALAQLARRLTGRRDVALLAGAYLAVAGLAIASGVRAAMRGDPIGGAVAGSVVSFLISGMFDNVLEAPRIATLFFLICFAGTMLWETKPFPQPSGRTA